MIIHLNEVSKSFKDTIAIDGVSLRVKQGEAFGYLGHNGSGKTTTIRLLLGLLHPDSGNVAVFGDDPYEDSPRHRAMRKRIGVLLEKDALYANMTAWENLAFWAQLYGFTGIEAEQRVKEAISNVALEGRAHTIVKQFSKGMRRQVAIARALLCKPHLLILDEPTSGLDPVARVQVRGILEKLVATGDCTIFISSHDLDEVEKLCNRVMIIERGREVLSGTMAQLRSTQPEVILELKESNGVFMPRTTQNTVQQLEYVQGLDMRDNRAHILLRDYSYISNIISILSKDNVKIESVIRNNRTLEDIYYNAVTH